MERDHSITLRVAIILGLAILAAVPYLQTRHHEFVNFDDTLYVTENDQVQRGLNLETLQWAFTNIEVFNWHPITWVSHLLDWQLYGEWAGGHHVTNVLLHSLTTVLLWMALVSLTGSIWRSAIVAGMFAVHPLHVESVAWISERKDLLSAAFGFAAIWCYSAFAKRGGWIRYIGVCTLFAFSLMSKAMLVTLPCALLLLDIWPLRRISLWNIGAGHDRPDIPRVTWMRAVMEKLPLLAMSAGISAITVIAQRDAMPIGNSFAMETRLANAIDSYVHYLSDTLWPVTLAPFYPHPSNLRLDAVWLPIATLVIISVLAIVTRRMRPWIIIGWLLFLGLLVPVIGLVQVGSQARADRYMYVPLIAVTLMVVWNIPNWRSHALRAVAGIVIAGVIIVLAWLSTVQTRYWRDSRTLFERTIAITERNYMAEHNLGHAADTSGDMETAMRHYQKALSYRSSFVPSLEALATSMLRLGRTQDAIELLQAARSHHPRSATINNALGITRMQAGDFAAAEPFMKVAAELQPRNMDVRGNYGVVLLQLKRYDEAAAQFFLVRKARPDRIGVRLNLAQALVLNGRRQEAIAELQDLVQQGPTFGPSHMGLEQRKQLHDQAREMLTQLQSTGNSP